MGLITVPLTVNDGTDDRIFDFLYQIPGSTLGSIYNEPAASSSTESMLKCLHTTAKSGRERHMIQSSELVALVSPSADEPTSDGIIVNITVSHHPKHAAADVEKRLKLLTATVAAVGFTTKLMAKNI